MKLIAVDGPPGTGKTRTIIETAKDWDDESSAVITYTNDAAGVLRKRAEWLRSGTIYSLSWPYVSPYVQGKVRGSGPNVTYGSRRIHHLFDPALIQYEKDAPSNRAPTRQDELARQLHAWGAGDPPFDLRDEAPKGALKFILPLARWIEAGCPMPEHERLEQVAIDEAQDMSWVELRAVLGLLKEGGVAYAYGDPGQAIFGRAKGIEGTSLPPVWVSADEKREITTGYRVGDPTASVAAQILWSYYERPASLFKAKHQTDIMNWDVRNKPVRGLAMGYSRRSVGKAFREWGLRNTGVVPNVAAADKELVLSTGHAAKGAEADDIYLLPWSRIAIERLEQRNPETLRLLYVMLTRARRRVFVPTDLKARLPL